MPGPSFMVDKSHQPQMIRVNTGKGNHRHSYVPYLCGKYLLHDLAKASPAPYDHSALPTAKQFCHPEAVHKSTD